MLFAALLLGAAYVHAQQPSDSDAAPVDDQGNRLFTIDTPASLDFKQEEEPIPTDKKKKRKKKVFYGIKTKKGFTRRGYGSRITYEIFYYLKKPDLPNAFVRDVYYYDFDRHEIRKTSHYTPKMGALLHGPYVKKQGDVVLEEGIFYKGTKNGRWMKYTTDSTLVDKEKYFRGWPKESLVGYYDPNDRKKVREIIPVEYGEREGYYYMFHENGQVAVNGEYHWNHRVGEWTEYYPDGRKKKVIAYPEDPYDPKFKPYIKQEWNDKGREIYRNNGSG